MSVSQSHSLFDVADDAFVAWAAIQKAEAADPRLKDNPHWTMLRQDAWERFWIAWGRLPQ